MEYGYARVSTKEQNEQRQMIALQDFGIAEEAIYLDKQSGKDFARPQYQKLLRKQKRTILLSLRASTDSEEIMRRF